MKKQIVWIHGFAGRPNNSNFMQMVKCNPQFDWYSIEVDHHALASAEKIDRYIAEHNVAMVAGTSLGGFYTLCAHFAGPKLVVNPATNPVRDLRQFLGHNVYKAGRPDGQTDFEFTEEMLNEFGQLVPNTSNVVCHYTAHDGLLGEDIKKEYEQLFEERLLIPDNILPGHFLTGQYVKTAFTETVNQLLTENHKD